MEELRSSETSLLTRATRRNILEDAILHSHRRENLKSYIIIIIFWRISDKGDWSSFQPQISVLALQNLTVAQLAMKFPAHTEPEASPPYSQWPLCRA
jgi:hypothetical protein